MTVKTLYPATQLRELYDAFGYLKEDEQIELAELHVAKPTRLSNRLAHSLKTVASESYPPINGEFIGGSRSDLPDPPTRLSKIKDTDDFVSNLADGQWHEVENQDTLGFHYVAREVSPLRITTEKGPRPARRSLDLMLANSQGAPIAAELKIRTDRPSYYALIQALMYMAELHSKSQRERLLKYYRDDGIRPVADAPLIDVYLISFEPPPRSRYRTKFDAATEEIAKNLVDDDRFADVIGRIASIEARIDHDRLVFDAHFAFSSSATPATGS